MLERPFGVNGQHGAAGAADSSLKLCSVTEHYRLGFGHFERALGRFTPLFPSGETEVVASE